MTNNLNEFIEKNVKDIENMLADLLSQIQAPKRLRESMAYSVQAGGKRIRPLLILATLEDLGTTSKDALTVACAVELIHTYSLIHDDLPSMDNDDFRRGKPTNHKVYGDAMAILAGDAMQTMAFEILTNLEETRPEVALKLIQLLTVASGAEGMVAGQVLDIEGEKMSLTIEQLEQIHFEQNRRTSFILH